jgi:hypothetical protein
MKTYRNIAPEYGDNCPVTVEDYEHICAENAWEHGKFTADENGIYEDGKLIAEPITEESSYASIEYENKE